MKRLIILLLLLSIIAGCSNVYSAEEGYRMANINNGFPVPKNASEIVPEICTTEIAESAKYSLKDIGGKQGEPPAHYLEEIEKWGWEELEDQRVGNVHYYKKEDKIMSLVFQEHIFDVFEMSDEVKM